MSRADDIREGRARPVCIACGQGHGGVVEELACLRDAIVREREHPDRLRGQAAREAFEAWARCKR